MFDYIKKKITGAWFWVKRKAKKALVVLGLISVAGAASVAPIGPSVDFEYLYSYETLKFDTASGDLGLNQYAFDGTEYYYREDLTQNFIATTSPSVIIGKTRVDIVSSIVDGECVNCATYAVYRHPTKGFNIRVPLNVNTYRAFRVDKNARPPRHTERERLIGLVFPRAAYAGNALMWQSDYTRTAEQNSVTSYSFSHKVSYDNSALVVGVLSDDTTCADANVTSVTFGGVSLTESSDVCESTDVISAAVYYGTAVAAGTNNVVVNFSGVIAESIPVAISIPNADLSDARDAFASSGTTAQSANVTINMTQTSQNSLGYVFLVSGDPNDRFFLSKTGTIDSNVDIGGEVFVYMGDVRYTSSNTYSFNWQNDVSDYYAYGAIVIKARNCNDLVPCVDGYIGESYFYSGQNVNSNNYALWTAPAGVTSADVACWGGGGAGDIIANSGGGGGGGGAFASSTVTVTPGASYTIKVGDRGIGGTSPTAGGDSTFATTTVVAKGGSPGNSTSGGAGGSEINSVGDVKYNGGYGGNGNSSYDSGGGGGGSGGPKGSGLGAVNAGSTGGDGGKGNNNKGNAGYPGKGAYNSSDKGDAGGFGVFGGSGAGGGDNSTGAYAAYIAGGGGGAEVRDTANDKSSDGGAGMCIVVYNLSSARRYYLLN